MNSDYRISALLLAVAVTIHSCGGCSARARQDVNSEIDAAVAKASRDLIMQVELAGLKAGRDQILQMQAAAGNQTAKGEAGRDQSNEIKNAVADLGRQIEGRLDAKLDANAQAGRDLLQEIQNITSQNTSHGLSGLDIALIIAAWAIGQGLYAWLHRSKAFRKFKYGGGEL